jgi:1-phosphofructokinase family hexose kinase
LIFCSLLNPAVDVFYTVEELRSGSTLVDLPARVYPAGKGLNVARVVKTLGEDVTVIGLMGEDDHRRFTRYLDGSEIGHLLYQVPGDIRINMTIREQSTSGISHFNSVGPALSSRIQDEFLGFVRPYISAGDFWCLSGGVPQGFDASIYADLIGLCRHQGVETLLDTRGNPLKLGVRAKPLAIKPNIAELESFFGEQVQGVHHIALKGKRFLDMGIRYAFITLGSDGMIAIHENDCLLCSPPQVKTVDTVGCGDALVAGIIVAQKRNFSFSEMCRMAVACGTSKSMHEGPGVVTRDEIWQLMEDIQITAA